jgi:hypothetical protein
MALNDPTDKDKENKEKCKKLCELTEEDIEKLLEKRLSFTGEGIDIYSRYSAYDYCYNCFRHFHEVLEQEKRKLKPSEMEILCLQLGLFLGTWGMFRNSDLQTKSFRIYEPLIEKIFEEKDLWNTDVKNYCDENGKMKEKTWNDICHFKKEIDVLLGLKCVLVTDTLATKIMMVVFGCVPAYDSYFKSTLEPVPEGLDQESLEYIYDFYHKKKDCLDKKQKELKTVSVKGSLTAYTYTMAKIIDIIGFREKEESDIKYMKATPAKFKTGKRKGELKGITEWKDLEERNRRRKDRIKKQIGDSKKG